MEADPAAPRHRSRNLPAASGKPLHLEERVPGCDGEVSGEGGAVHKPFPPWLKASGQ